MEPVRFGQPQAEFPHNRLTLVLDRSSDEWKRTVELYEVRNQIAHGELRSEGIDVSTVIEDFSRIQSSLARGLNGRKLPG